MIIQRYIIREILKPAATICAVLVCIFGSYISTRYGEDAIQGLLPASSVIQLILLRIVIALEVLLPTALFFSVVIALSRLYRDAELVAMFACGISITRVIKSVLLVALAGSLLIACLSFFLRPWAWQQFFQVKEEAKANFDLSRMTEGKFYKNGNRIIFAEKIDHKQNRASKLFIQKQRANSRQIIYADHAIQYRDKITGRPLLLFQGGHLYEFSSINDKGLILEFETSAMPLEPKEIIEQEYKVKAAATATLFHSSNLEEQAELQWRLTAPLSIILLALLGIPLSRSAPRQPKYANTFWAIGIFAVYYNFSVLTKKWMAQGAIAPLPGIWWGQILLATLVWVLLFQPLIYPFKLKR